MIGCGFRWIPYAGFVVGAYWSDGNPPVTCIPPLLGPVCQPYYTGLISRRCKSLLYAHHDHLLGDDQFRLPARALFHPASRIDAIASGSTHPVVSLPRTTWVGVSGREATVGMVLLPLHLGRRAYTVII